MRNILVPMERSATLKPVMATAWMLANRFDAYIEGYAVMRMVAPFIASDFPMAPVEADPEWQAETLSEVRKEFDAFFEARRRESIAAGGTPPAVGWARKNEVDFGAYGRIFDLTIVGRPTGDVSESARATLETALFESGRPILIVPPEPPATIGETVLIAWNKAAETARTIAAAEPFLRSAKRVLVLPTHSRTIGPDAEQLAEALRRSDVQAELLKAPDDNLASGPATLRACAEAGADLLVKGGYTQSRLSQLIFGGATSHIIDNAQLPVLMAH